MPVGDAERSFQYAAASDGIDLVRAHFSWLNQRGHLGLPGNARGVTDSLRDIFSALGGIRADQDKKSLRALPGDFVHTQSGVLVEVDEYQHFTSHRNVALSLYPHRFPLGFEIAAYRELCDQWSARSDRYRQAKSATGFGEGGRQRQRAYHDSLRDLIAPVMGHPPVVLIPVFDKDGAGAYARIRDQLQAAIGRG